MLIPIQHIGIYDSDPLGEFPVIHSILRMTLSSIQEKFKNGVEEEYHVMAEDVPLFLYEDLLKYDPENVLSGFMRGYFLIRICVRQAFQSKS